MTVHATNDTATAGSRTRVLIADDQRLMRAGFAMLVDSADDLAVVGEAETGTHAVELAVSTQPDVILMDIRMPDLDGIEATRLICADPACAGTKIIVLTTFDLDEYVYDALRAGASGFLLKDTEPAELLAAIRVVAAGEALLAPSITRRLIEQIAARPDRAAVRHDRLSELTERETEVVALVGKGLNNTEIGEALFVSPTTAKTHVSRSMVKLHARDRAQLVTIAYESGLVVPGVD
ncbi:MAG: response regulator [Ilumatobacter sp.]